MAYGSRQAKKYSDGDTSISWRKGNKVLRIEGKGNNQINATLCSIICNSGISHEETGAVNNLSSVSHRTTSELSVEMEGVKLDITIAEKDICNNKLTIENVEARLNKEKLVNNLIIIVRQRYIS
jgi:hypothetical protein